jgi:2-polyprenyl-3-methyl-5-hydroxy-6-metoxy-1,4-benzoquinol methylase
MNPIEKQYGIFFQDYERFGPVFFGPLYSDMWRRDPKKLVITLSRYKFVSKMLVNKKEVLEVGSADGWAAKIVAKEVGKLILSDMDEIWAKNIAEIYGDEVEFKKINFVQDDANHKFDAIYALDVLEHVPSEMTNVFCANLVKSLKENGVAIIGMPSIESQIYASEASKLGHVNCMNGEDLRQALGNHFENVFIFSMNDEVIHTGFSSMAHYLIALCTNPKI